MVPRLGSRRRRAPWVGRGHEHRKPRAKTSATRSSIRGAGQHSSERGVWILTMLGRLALTQPELRMILEIVRSLAKESVTA